MRYLSKVILKNFQSHQHSIVEFENGLNVIVGPSDTGKSAIIRGIKWVLYNEPSGDYFIREGENECSVTLEFSDGIAVERFRSRSKNIYILHRRDGEKIKYQGFGTSVPDEIVEAIRIKKIHLDGEESSSINIGEQLEGPFLLSEKTSTRASAIGRLIGVNIIDEALRETLRDLRNLNNNKRYLDERTESLKDELKKYKYLDKLSEQATNIEGIKKLIKEKSIKLERLKSILNNYSKMKNELKEVNGYLEKVSDLDILEEKVKEISYLNSYYKILSNRRKDLLEYRKGITLNLNIIEKLDKINKIEKNYSLLLDYYSRRYNLEKLNKNLKSNQKEKFKMNKLSEQLRNITQLEKKLGLIEFYIDKLENFNYLSKKFERNKERLEIGRKYIKSLNKIDYIQDIYEDLGIRLERLRHLSNINKKIKSYKKHLTKERQEREISEENIRLELEEYRKLLEKIEVCPVCLSNINDDKIQHIVEHYK